MHGDIIIIQYSIFYILYHITIYTIYTILLSYICIHHCVMNLCIYDCVKNICICLIHTGIWLLTVNIQVTLQYICNHPEIFNIIALEGRHLGIHARIN